MSDIQGLVAVAVIGTLRGKLPVHGEAGQGEIGQGEIGQGEAALAETLNSIVKPDPESTLLARAAIASLAQVAGQQPKRGEVSAVQSAPPETLSAAPEVFARHFETIMAHTPALLPDALLPEWLKLCSAGSWHIPHRFLPVVLEYAAGGRIEVQEALAPALSKRGAWLAQLNPKWRRLAEIDLEVWEKATDAEKEAIIRTLKAHDLAAAATWLNTHFKTEPTTVRKRLLNSLQRSWRAEDAQLEPLLEEALTDRSADVREVARVLLQGIPASAYNTRMAARAKALISTEKASLLDRLKGKKKYFLNLPTMPDSKLKQDGLIETIQAETTQASQRLEELLTKTHSQRLLEELELNPKTLCELAQHLDALDALARGAVAVSHSALALQLLPYLKSTDPQYLPLLRILPEQQRLEKLHELLKTENYSMIGLLLSTLPKPWPIAVSNSVLQKLLNNKQSERKYDETNWDAVSRLAEVGMHPDTTFSIEELSHITDYAYLLLINLHTTTELRAQIYADFKAARV